MNPNQRQPGESYDFFITRRKEWQLAEKLMNREHQRVLWDPNAAGPGGKARGPYIREKHGPLTGATPREMKIHEQRRLRRVA